MARQLRRLGYQVVALARTGPEAIAHALALRPHVVLMDIRWHGAMDGIDAVRHIQAAAPMLVVYVSAHADAATVARLQASTRGGGGSAEADRSATLHAALHWVLARRLEDSPG